ncbi:MAG TPA: hypothetical protein H9700_06860 [Candidatus Eisenbergiella intestinipullorum]|nr:hypothetical protein [Candidatus Eisenbergiella intestinipullorum]
MFWKKAMALTLTAMLAFPLAACAGQQGSPFAASEESVTAGEEMPAPATENGGAEETAEGENGDILVAYFSWADNAVLAEDVDAVTSPSVIPPGNVQQLAGWVQEETGGNLFSIRVTDPYPSDWDACLDRANEERGADARPELLENVENLERYDTVFLGYPNWWYGVPMALLSFLEQNDLAGKQVYLFCSHGTGGLANSVELITEAAPAAEISDHIFDCYEEEAASSEEDIRRWVKELGFSAEDAAAQTDAGQEAEQMTAEQQKGAAMWTEQDTSRQIAVQSGDNRVVYGLNDSAAADSLYEQLPLTIEVEDYGANEKIFYPPQELNTENSPLAEDGAGTLAYYAPWGDVVMFYADYRENPSLFELGQVISGGDLVSGLSGTVTITAVEQEE